MKQYIIGKNIYKNNPNIPILWLTYKDYKYIKFTIKFLKKNSELKQGFKIFIGNDFVGNVIVDGKEIKLPKRKWRQLTIKEAEAKVNFWENIPFQEEIVFEFNIKKGYISIKNSIGILDDEGYYYGTDKCMFMVENISENEQIIHCGEINGNGKYDSLLVHMKEELEEIDLQDNQ